MNALLAACFVSVSLVVLAISAVQNKHHWVGHKWGLALYGVGTLLWSIKGLYLESTGLMLISVLQTVCVFMGLVFYEQKS